MPSRQAAAGHLSVSVTQFCPMPTHCEVTEFGSEEELLDAVLASCYIPVAYEHPVVLRGLGFCVDGCVCSFLPNARCRVSPYHCHLADVSPVEEYNGSLVFNLLHGHDVLRLFEDGYLDCVKWLRAGAASKAGKRIQHLDGTRRRSFRALLVQGVRVFLSMSGVSSRARSKA